MNIVRKFKNSAVFRNIVYAYIIKAGSVLIGVLLVSAYIKYFSDAVILGIWYTILSIVSWVINFDVGIGHGLRNMSVKAMACKDTAWLKRLVSSGYVIIAIICLAIFFVGSILIWLLDWNAFFKVSAEQISSQTLTLSIFISFAGIVLQLVLKLVTSLFNAMEKTALTSLLTLLTNLLIVLFVMFFRGKDQETNLLALSVMYFFALNLPYAVASIIVYSRKLKEIRPSLRAFEWRTGKSILSLGGKFFWIQIMLMVVTATNELFITRLVSVDQVVVFQIYNKLYGTVLLLFSLITNPMWSAMGKAWQLEDYSGVRRMYRNLHYLALLWTLGILLMGIFLQPIVNIWLREDAIAMDIKSILIFSVYSIIMVFAYAQSALSNAISLLGGQMWCYTVAAVLKYPLCLLFLPIVKDWNTIILVNALIMLPYVIIQPIALRNRMRAAEQKAKMIASNQ